MPKLTIDGTEIEVQAGTTVFQACQQAGVEVPHFCFHERLAIAGNCRMCLVELEKAPKPIASCAYPTADGMVIKTNTPMVEKARKGVMEFLLINHPLDCPICDQGGECDLQDEAMAYGKDRSRYEENRRAVADKYMGPLVKTTMTRCIHCTRCVRFITDVAGVEELGATGRGENMEITTYVEKALTSELSGNIIDLCPVGALTSKPYEFKARSWELKKTESIDVFDALGTNICINTRGPEVMRILPRLNEDINEEWMADKARFAYDGLKRQRLDRPYIRQNGKLKECSWDAALQFVATKIETAKSNEMAAIAGDLCDVESMFALKELMQSLDVQNLDCRQDAAFIPHDTRAHYLFNTSIAGIEKADVCLIMGANLRWEAPLLNARIRKTYLQSKLKVGMIGEELDLTYPYTYIGAGPEVIDALLKNTHSFAALLKNAKNPMIIIGSALMTRADAPALFQKIQQLIDTFGIIRDDWNGYNLLHKAASRVGGLDIGFVPNKSAIGTEQIIEAAQKGSLKLLYLLGADELHIKPHQNCCVVYQGHHGDMGAQIADVILPGAAYTEKSGTYINIEGRVQRGEMALFPPHLAKEDWKIIRAISGAIGKALPYNSLEELRYALTEKYPHLGHIDQFAQHKWQKIHIASSSRILDKPFLNVIQNYYMTDVISRASLTMAKCTKDILNIQEQHENKRVANA